MGWLLCGVQSVSGLVIVWSAECEWVGYCVNVQSVSGLVIVWSAERKMHKNKQGEVKT